MSRLIRLVNNKINIKKLRILIQLLIESNFDTFKKIMIKMNNLKMID